MGKMLLGFAAAAAVIGLAAPAAAAGSGNGASAQLVSGGPGSGFGGHHGNGNGGVWINSGEWARYNNEAFKPDSYNDWWHDRPDRAYPAWMRNNQNCQRQWYSGSTLRC